MNGARERRPANNEEVDFAGEKLVQEGRDFCHIATGSAGDQRKFLPLAQTFAGEPTLYPQKRTLMERTGMSALCGGLNRSVQHRL